MSNQLSKLLLFWPSRIVVAMPQVYDVTMPQWYKSTMDYFAWFDPDWTSFLLPGQCIGGGFRTRLLLRGVGPLVLLAILPCLAAVRECVQARRERRQVSCNQALLSALPAMLFLAHAVCPRVSAGIFSAWDCDSYILDTSTGVSRSFLHEDLSVVCTEGGVKTPAHAQLRALAALFVVIWPVGLPICDILLLVFCGKSILQRRSTRWVRAVEYLHKEYKLTFYW